MQEFQDSSVRYKKIFCQGHAIPNDAVTDQFFSFVDEFLESNEVDKIIGVHCTHGLNRTGYLICKYMIKKLGFTAEEAISAFEKARGHPMERDLYLQDLRELDGKHSEEQTGVISEISSVPNVNFHTSNDPSLGYGMHISNSAYAHLRNNCPAGTTGVICDNFSLPNRSENRTDHRPVDYKNHVSNYWYPPAAYRHTLDSDSKYCEDFYPSSTEFHINHESNSLFSFAEYGSGGRRRLMPNLRNEYNRGDRDHTVHRLDSNSSTHSIFSSSNFHPREQLFYSTHRQDGRGACSSSPRCPGAYSSRYSPY